MMNLKHILTAIGLAALLCIDVAAQTANAPPPTPTPRPQGRGVNEFQVRQPEQENRADRRMREREFQNEVQQDNRTGGIVPEGRQRPATATTEEGQARTGRTQVLQGPALGEFILRVDENTRLLRHHPAGLPLQGNATVIMGNELLTEITFENRDEIPLDAVRLILSYNPEYLEPLALNDSELTDFMDGEPTAEVDHNRGVILYEATLDRPLTIRGRPLVSIRWKPKKVISETSIEFSRRDQFYTEISGLGVDLLGSRRIPGDGTLNLNVTILPTDPREAEAMLINPSVYQLDSEKLGGVVLSLMPPEGRIYVGDTFGVDVVLDNTAFSKLSTVTLLISYDPEVLEVLDVDRDNLITREINIHDGPFHEAFGWDYHVNNRVMPSRGMIAYRVATSTGEAARGSSHTLARIYAVAKRPTSGTPIEFVFSRRTDIQATSATYLGADVLGRPNVFGDGTESALITIESAPRSSFADAREESDTTR